MQPLIVIVPLLPPSVNHMYASNRDGSKRLTQEALTFRQAVAAEARSTANLTGWRVPDGRLKLAIKLTFGSRARQDIDNRAKSAIDALALALGFDDVRIDRVVIERIGVEPRRPLCELILAAFDGRRLVAAGDVALAVRQ